MRGNAGKLIRGSILKPPLTAVRSASSKRGQSASNSDQNAYGGRRDSSGIAGM